MRGWEFENVPVTGFITAISCVGGNLETFQAKMLIFEYCFMK